MLNGADGNAVYKLLKSETEAARVTAEPEYGLYASGV